MKSGLKVNWFGSFSQGEGYSGSGELICVALEKLGVDVRTVGFSRTHDKNLTPAGLRIKRKPFEKADIAICYGLPVSFDSMDHWKYRIGFTMFETDRLPTTRVWTGPSGNATGSCDNLDMLLVPSKHSQQLFSDSGVTVPIEVVHLGIDPNLYRYINRPVDRATFTFLQSGNLSIRKNPGAVISAFMALFGPRKDVRLILKTSRGSLGSNTQFLTNNISIIDKYLTQSQMEQLYQEADCFVFPSRGEGFGLPPLEAMATGLPAIIAENTGMLEYCDPKYVYSVNPAGLAPAKAFPKEWGDVGNWYESDFKDLKKKMRYVFNNRESAQNKGRRASDWVRSTFTFDNTAKRIVELLHKLYN